MPEISATGSLQIVDSNPAIEEEFGDDFVIYTGYNLNEIKDEIDKIKKFKNIVVKLGRFIPNSKKKFDKILGVTLASENQYAILLS